MYRKDQTIWSQFILSDTGQRHFSGMDPEDFRFLWYVYNRGGICNATTANLFFRKSRAMAYLKLKLMIDRKWITPLFHPSAYQRKNGRGRKPDLFRVSNKFLAGVDNKDSHIRKTKDLHKAIVPLAITHFFLQPEHRHFTLINRRERKDFLMDRYPIKEKELPKYFVDKTGKKYVISLNHEIVLEGQKVRIVWYPETNSGSKFTQFAKKWDDVFKASHGDIECLVITHNPKTKAYFDNLCTAPVETARPKDQGWNRHMKTSRADRVTAPSVRSSRPKKKPTTVSFKIRTHHFPDIWTAYTDC